MYSAGFHSIGEYDKYLRYIESPRKRQFGEKSGVFQTVRRSPSPVVLTGEASTSVTDKVPSSVATQPEGRNTEGERPKTLRKRASATNVTRSETRRPKSSLHRKTVESETGSDRSQRKQTAPLVRPKTGRRRTDKSPTTQRRYNGDVKWETEEAEATNSRCLAMATDGVISESSGGSKPASISEGAADITCKPNIEEHIVEANGVPSADSLQSTSGRSKEVVNKTGYKILPLNSRQETGKHAGEQAITVEDVGTKDEKKTSNGQIGDQTSKDNVIVVRDMTKNDENRQRKGDEIGLPTKDYDSEHTPKQTKTRESRQAGKADDDDVTKEGVRNDAGSVTPSRRTDDNPHDMTSENGTGVVENDWTITSELDTIQSVSTSSSEKGKLTSTVDENVDDTSEESGTQVKYGDGSVTGQTLPSFEEQRGGAASDSGRTTAEGVSLAEGPLERLSTRADHIAEPSEERSVSPSISDKDDTASDTNGLEDGTDEDDETKQDPENETPVQADAENHLDTTLSTATDSDETSYFASDSATESDHSATSSRESATHAELTDVGVEAEDGGRRGDEEPQPTETVVTSTGLTAADLARLQAAEDELFGSTSSGDNQSYESSESSSLTGRYVHSQYRVYLAISLSISLLVGPTATH